MQEQEMHEPKRRRNLKYPTEELRLAAVKASRDKWLATNKEKHALAKAQWKANNKDKVSGYHLTRKYGLTTAEYDAMFEERGGACDICGKVCKHINDPGTRGEKICVDHCHTTGVVRGMLCQVCNRNLSIMDAHRDAVLNYLDKPEDEKRELRNKRAREARAKKKGTECK